ncbi:WXG100 family type VII secretion target [Saccharopolyspora indica]|uniref:WXG100 family type VII secretion target n=1 Tax=Saccharopolyspora indica TaxID=1229659 RepID=UPI0022EAD5B4|nr:WXG100 family type VII secretion target [Saccharopolyspora indica]MDA3647197.1 WXG100 family type VII secretion target [Saccharopolyspora indica]
MPTGDQLHGVTETLQRAAQMAGTVSDDIQAHRAALRPIVDALKGQWEGTARPAFDNAHAQWEAGIVRLVAALTNLGENTRFSSNAYDQADQTSASGLNSVQSAAPFGGALQA